MNYDLKIIKKKYGEKMMHLCRKLFPTLLEQKGLLSKLLLEHFNPSRFLYNDLITYNKVYDFKTFICNYVNVDEDEYKTEKTPKELLSEAGYYLYECKSEDDIQKFKKYYKKGETLCTFNGGRLDECFVFFAVKKNVDEIKRKNFTSPKREDEYGTSVMSIQFSIDDSHTLSIKNRYNMTVTNPDATFANNLNNIIPGLTYSFEKEYGMGQKYKNKFELSDYTLANDGKYYKYNYEINNIHYCPNNIIIDNGNVKKLEKEKYILLDYFILDLENKEILLYDKNIEDSFIDGITNINKINVANISGGKEIIIEPNGGEKITIELDNTNKIVKYKNNNIKKIKNNFLFNNVLLKEFIAENVEEIGNGFLYCNMLLEEFLAENVERIGNEFLRKNTKLKNIKLPKCKSIKDLFLFSNLSLKELVLENVEEIGSHFLYENSILERIELPKVKTIGYAFLYKNKSLKEFIAENVEKIGDDFLYENRNLKRIKLPKVKKIYNYFLADNLSLEEFIAENLEEIGFRFLFRNKSLKIIDLPKIEKIDRDFLPQINSLKRSKRKVLLQLYLNNLKKKKDDSKKLIYN